MHPSVAADDGAFLNGSAKIVWLDVPGPGGGGGGGGNRVARAHRKAELKGKDKITVPVGSRRPWNTQGQTAGRSASEPDDSRADAGVRRSGSGGSNGRDSDVRIAGLGRGGGAGTGGAPASARARARVSEKDGRRHRRRSVSSGQRRRNAAAAEGSEAAVHRAGDAREDPGRGAARVHRRPDGTVGNIRVVRSLDSSFGLDQEAIKPRASGDSRRHEARSAGGRCSSQSRSHSRYARFEKFVGFVKFAVRRVRKNKGPRGFSRALSHFFYFLLSQLQRQTFRPCRRRGRRASPLPLLFGISDECFRREEQRGDGRGVLQRGADDLVGSMTPAAIRSSILSSCAL